MTTPDRPRRCRTGVIRPDHGGPRMLFAYTSPNGRLAAVVAAEDIEHAWIVATGWDRPANSPELQNRKWRERRGWRVWPCMVEWEESDD